MELPSGERVARRYFSGSTQFMKTLRCQWPDVVVAGAGLHVATVILLMRSCSSPVIRVIRRCYQTMLSDGCYQTMLSDGCRQKLRLQTFHRWKQTCGGCGGFCARGSPQKMLKTQVTEVTLSRVCLSFLSFGHSDLGFVTQGCFFFL